MSVTYHGELYGVILPDGTWVEVPRVALGTARGFGWVTAPSREALLSGRWFDAAGGSQFARVDEVLYTRRRREGSRWRHEVRGTELGVSVDGRPVLRFVGGAMVRAPRVCAVPPGEYICDG